jgi:multidrug efflux pump subunit AcrA (membrane-fusion protein)
MKKKGVAALSGIGFLLVIWAFMGRDAGDSTAIFVSPKEGDFDVVVSATGELRARNSTKIRGPQGARAIQMWQMTIQHLVPEGTVVRQGDVVAELDRSDILTRLETAQLEVQRVESQYEQAQLDSLLTLSEARDKLENLELELEEREIAVEQSVYESPAVQRRTQIELEKTKRQLAQEKNNYVTRVHQAVARLREIEAQLIQDRNSLNRIQQLVDEFTIRAPENGMIVYARDWRGQKTTTGSIIQTWDPVVAELPDLSLMESVTYINEVDIQKIRVGQPVTLGLDAMRGKQLTGIVTSVANIGEQRPNSNSKVFEVLIKIHEADTTLRPAMTTSNDILVETEPSALYVPLEAIHLYGQDHFIFKRDGLQTVMQQIVMGSVNENDAVVHEGITKDDRVLISMPPDTSGIRKLFLPDEVLEKYRPRDTEQESFPETEDREIEITLDT